MSEQYKNVLFNTSKVESYDENDHSIVSYISTKTPDYVKDTVDPNGLTFKKLDNGQPKYPTVLFGHDASQPAVGKCMWIKTDEKGILAKTKFANTERGRELEYLYKEGYMTDYSIRLSFDKDGIEPNDFGGYTFKQYTIPEYSLVNIGCNFEAVSKTKSLEDIKEATKHLETEDTKKDFEQYIANKEMEDKVKSMESDMTAMQARMTAMESRMTAMEEMMNEEPDEPAQDEPTPEEPKSLTIDDVKDVMKNIFKK